MPLLTRRRTLAAVALSLAAVTACSSTDGPSGASTREPASEPAWEAGSAQPSADADNISAQPSATAVPVPEQPAFADVPEEYYVVNDGRAMVPERAGVGCEGLPSLEPRTNDDEDRVHGYWYTSLRDLGPIDGASGEAIYDQRDQPVAYVAAPGDTMSAIAARFCIDHYPYLEWINAIRRGDNTTVADARSMPVYAGDTINLDPYTIATVGDENGVVRNNAIDFHIPPQH